MVAESPAYVEPSSSAIPQHIAIIMDGNGRWAQRRHLPRLAGHRAGVRNIHRIANACFDRGVRMLTVYAFSTENWGRPAQEVSGLMTIFAEATERETRNLHQKGVCVRHVGSMEGVPVHLRRAIENAVTLTHDNPNLMLNVAFNYGGRAEIVDAVKRIVSDGLSADEISEETINGYLYTADLPDPDLVIRTAGEMRLSNFLIWQAAYSEYYSTPTYWPEFGERDLDEAIESYARRHRKFGKL
ncbi:MAG TPA: isoprenyl transferase [Chloroflexi bacterium]|jgi:undecaprenyl diphosphate synthase|nr:isoprenyl transferase [Chloroflexota bacterium]